MGMKYLKNWQVFESVNELTEYQIRWLDNCSKGGWNFDSTTGLVNCDGDFVCRNHKLTDFLGIRFGEIKGSFYCDNNQLASLEGAPLTVGGNFCCDNNQLHSLEGAPLTVGGVFSCDNNPVSKSSFVRIWELMMEHKDYGFALVMTIGGGIPKNDKELLLAAYPIDSNPSLLNRLAKSISESPDSMRILSMIKKGAPDIWKGVIAQMPSPEAGEESTILGDYGF